MACAEFEDRLLAYAELEGEARRVVDIHLVSCAGCRAYLDTLDALEDALTARFAAARLSPEFRLSVLLSARRQAPLEHPSYLPEVLDFAGWAAIIIIAAGLLYYLNPPAAAIGYAAAAAAAGLFLTGVWMIIRSYAELKN